MNREEFEIGVNQALCNTIWSPEGRIHDRNTRISRIILGTNAMICDLDALNFRFWLESVFQKSLPRRDLAEALGLKNLSQDESDLDGANRENTKILKATPSEIADAVMQIVGA